MYTNRNFNYVLVLSYNKIKVYEKNDISRDEVLISVFYLDEGGVIQHDYWDEDGKQKHSEDTMAFIDFIQEIYRVQENQRKFRIEEESINKRIEFNGQILDIIDAINVRANQCKNGEIEINELVNYIKKNYIMKYEYHRGVIKVFTDFVNRAREIAKNIEGQT